MRKSTHVLLWAPQAPRAHAQVHAQGVNHHSAHAECKKKSARKEATWYKHCAVSHNVAQYSLRCQKNIRLTPNAGKTVRAKRVLG